jgi:HlyD family secretion protein
MFAEIGLGTEARQNLVAPAESILHINRSDYILVAGKDNLLRVAEVQIGEPHLEEVEILGGLLEGDRIVANGAILFKPVVIRSLVVPAETVSPMGGI